MQIRIDEEEGQALAEKAGQVNAILLRLFASLQASSKSETEQLIWDAQKQNRLMLNRLERLGLTAPAVGLTDREDAFGRDRSTLEIPLRQLSSDKAQRYARALRECAVACREMEQERGIEDGLTEMFEDYAESAELEVFGPVGLRG